MRVGVIGTGAMGINHIRNYYEMDGVELVGISDIDEQRVNSLAGTYETKAFTDYNELLKEELDAVSIVVPTKLHKQVCLDALAAGSNVLVEKPIADTPENADVMIKAAKDAGKALMVGHIERFNPAVIKLKEIIDGGLLGKIVSISTTRVGPYNPRIRDVGVILDIGVHDIDIISHLYDSEVKKVHAIAGADIHPFEDHASIHLRFDGDLAGLVDTNWLTPHKVRSLKAVGLEGVAYLDYMNQTVELHDNGWIRKAKVEQSEPLRNELEHFIECIRNGEMPCPNGDHGKHALEVCMAAIESYKEEKTIHL
ncbi:MAG: UDP-N-acetylglucosamine 3-dehydrogenase [Methanolobus sp.]|jgi:UDP-N-acetylglucosamine 3-dehydrogenase|uniref:Putative dehydrogenase n=1 Tax=Methanolobus tindarius DSM 2278 TaxID=1090322 RepID=W9DNZ4_METTI|nr:UDP-N-acetylglucosamine 3-dehydrogenase [Methanolobus tindarius]ETA66803.1 putative dehydrogenase [Methanolobus tindarius DSM 2278]MDK2940435.1 UDP-N-acetylglucosamine 3-dehydrogenase [Methanolobus sp.]